MDYIIVATSLITAIGSLSAFITVNHQKNVYRDSYNNLQRDVDTGRITRAEAYAQDLSRVASEHTIAQRQAEANHQMEIDRIRRTHQDEIHQITKTHQGVVDVLTAQVEALSKLSRVTGQNTQTSTDSDTNG